MRWLDTPPVWLIAFLAAGWSLSRIVPGEGLGAWAAPAGFFVLLLGLAAIALAAWEFRRARTTIVPHQEPTALITSGIYQYSRNPIYLGDVLVLTGLILSWGAALPLVLVPLFLLVIQRRFVRREERRLENLFGAAYRDWAACTRRWV